MKGKHIEFALGVAVGAVLFGGSVAFAAGILAEPSYQTFYVNDKQVELKAYAINGHNYVQLRDAGKAAGFNVCYDPARNAAVIQPDKPYTGEDMVAPTKTPSESVDYAAQANPAIFQGELSRENYNAIRDSILYQDEIIAGSYQPIPMGAFTPYRDVDEATVAVGCYPVYELISRPDGSYICNVKCPESYKPAVEHTKGFIDSLAGKSDREKVTEIAWYVADRITYAVKYPGPGEVLSQDGQVPGACMAYAYSFHFLCDQAGVPCILKRGGNHQWNMVYVEGQWWDVDVTAADAGDDTSVREYVTILNDPTAHELAGAVDEEPHVTAFVTELLGPGSTK